MNDAARKTALMVRGGWEGHSPMEATERFAPFLAEHGYDVERTESLDVYLDPEQMARFDLVVQCWTMGEMTEAHAVGLASAVQAGAGLAGWHGGIVDAFRNVPDYLQLTGGQFATHPGGFRTHGVRVVPSRADHPIVTGLDQWEQHTEQYWILTDAYNDVLATTRFEPEEDSPWLDAVEMPAVWTRRWGKGRVFVSTIGHLLEDLDRPQVRTLTERGLLWASR